MNDEHCPKCGSGRTVEPCGISSAWFTCGSKEFAQGIVTHTSACRILQLERENAALRVMLNRVMYGCTETVRREARALLGETK